MKHAFALVVLVALATTVGGQQTNTTSVTYPAKAGPGKGRHVVLLTGDEEYRSEEGLPMLAKILSQRHGFKTTVLFALDPDGTINPKNTASLSDSAALDTADAELRGGRNPINYRTCRDEYEPSVRSIDRSSERHSNRSIVPVTRRRRRRAS